MRLTLRTLLAYLDDVLEPARAKEIGKKLEESPVAQSLANRIREVVRKRRLTAPSLEGPESGLDPNIVAEYLDNQLSPAQVSQTERILLNSEMHLAETAAAHQILTLVLGEPVDVVPESRKRMYALGPVAPSDRLVVEKPKADEKEAAAERAKAATAELKSKNGVTTKKTKSEKSNGTAKPKPKASAKAKPSPVAAPSATQLVDVARDNEPSFWRRWAPVGIVGSLIGCWLFLQMTDAKEKKTDAGTKVASDDRIPKDKLVGDRPDGRPAFTFGKRTEPADNPPPSIAGNIPPGNHVDTPTKLAADTGENSKPNTGIDADAPPDAPVGDLASAAPGIPEPSTPAPSAPQPSDPEASTPVVADAGTKPVPAMDLDNIPAPPEVINDPATAVADADATPVDVKPVDADAVRDPIARATFRYQTTNGVLLKRVTNTAPWKLVSPAEVFGEGEELAVPMPYVAAFQPIDIPVLVTAGPDTRLTALAKKATGEMAFGFKIHSGHLVIERTAGAVAADETMVVVIAVAERRWKVELPPGTGRIGFEVTPAPPVRYEKTAKGFPAKVLAFGSVGEVIVTAEGEKPQKVGAGSQVPLAGPDAGQVLVEPGEDNNYLLKNDPVSAWIFGPDTPTGKRYAAMFQENFNTTEAAPDTMIPLVTAAKPWLSERAVQCLAVTNQYNSLVRSLGQAEHSEALNAAIRGLRTWLPQAKDNGEMLKEALQQEFPEETATAIYRLLWGFDEDLAREEETSKELVEWLLHENNVVHKLAYFHIIRLAGLQDEYRRNLTDDKRKRFHKKWVAVLKRQKTILPK